MYCMASGAGAVVTYTSNMGRFLFYVTKSRARSRASNHMRRDAVIRRNGFTIVSVDGVSPHPRARKRGERVTSREAV